MVEQWRPIAGQAGKYEVSNHGAVRSLRFVNGTADRLRIKPLILKQGRNQKGYMRVAINGKTTNVHPLVAAAFLPKKSPGQQVAHLDGNPGNNHAANLAWVSVEENHRHKKIHGTTARGSRCGNAKLTEVDVRKAWCLKAQGQSLTQIGGTLGVSFTAIYKIFSGKNWKHLREAGEGEA